MFQLIDDLRFDVRLRPTFHSHCHLIVQKQHDHTHVFVAVRQSIDLVTLTPQSASGTDATFMGFVGLADATAVPFWNQPPTFTTYLLAPSVARSFWERITSLSTLPFAPNGQGLDGIVVDGSITSATESRSFSFWSPDKHDQPNHGYIEALFDVIDSLALDTQTTIALEQVSRYFNLGLPIKELGGTPYTIRMYGHPQCLEEIRAFAAYFEHLPARQPLRIDMSNVERLGTILYPIFRQLLAKAPATQWIASGVIQQQLLLIGVPATHIAAPDETSDLSAGS